MLRPILRYLAALFAPALVLVALALVAPFVPVAADWLALSVVFAFACVSAEVLLSSAAAPALPPRALVFLALPVTALLALAFLGASVPPLVAASIVTVALLAAGTLVGTVVGRAIEHAGHLIVVAAVSSLVDAFSVLHPQGPTAQIVRVETALSLLVLPWPILGTDDVQPLLGVGDVAFAAIYVAVSRRHELPVGRTVLALACGLAVTLGVVALTGRPTPALPFLGAAVVIAHPEARALPRADRVKALLGLCVLAVLFGGLFLLR